MKVLTFAENLKSRDIARKTKDMVNLQLRAAGSNHKAKVDDRRQAGERYAVIVEQPHLTLK